MCIPSLLKMYIMQYLNFKSCHPPHVKRAIPCSQDWRLKRVCDSENAFEKRVGELKGFLVKWGYCSIMLVMNAGDEFKSYVEGRSFRINHRFNCNSEGVVYLISSKSCWLQYVGNTITAFRLRFNNHKSSLNRYGRGQGNIAGQHLYANFLWCRLLTVLMLITPRRGKVFGLKN